MKFILSLFFLIGSVGSLLSQTYTRTGYSQFWLSGSYHDTVRVVVEYNGLPGEGLVSTSRKDTLHNGQWVPDQKDFITGYGTDSLVTTSKLWSNATQDYTNYRKQKITSNISTNKPLQYLEQLWSAGQWLNATKEDIAYDANNFKTGVEISLWNGSWQVAARKRYFNNAAGKAIATYHDSLKAGNWDTYQVDSAQYDANGNKIEERTLLKVFNVLTRTSRTVYTYTTGNQLATGTVYINVAGLFEYPNLKSTYTLAGGDNLVNTEQQYNTVMPPAAPVWTNISRFIWDPLLISVQNATAHQCLAYPNPAANRLYVTGIEPQTLIRIVAMDGREMMTEPYSGSIGLTTLPPGLYVVEVPATGLRQRFVKE